MRKALSVTLLVVFLFNVGGYYIVFLALRYQTDKALTSRLDANLYEAAETFEIKIPVTLPYPIQSRDFERVDGRFEYQGQHFKLVKHKLSNDTLHVVCILDHEMRKLESTMEHFVKRTQPFSGTESGKNALNFLSKLLKDFCSHSALALVEVAGFTANLIFVERPELFEQREIDITGPPPRG